MKKSFFASALIVLVIGLGATVQAQDAAPQVPERQSRGGIVTLYALDPLSRAFCFRDGRAGLTIQNNRWTNRCSDLSFTLAGDGTFVSGIEVGRVAAIADLGTPDELRQRYGYDDASGGGEGFASLRLQDEKILILKDDNPNEKLQTLQEGAALFTNVGPSATAAVRLGHIYLVRVSDKKDKSTQQVVKLIVIAYRPNESVTLRWEPLMNPATASR